ALHGVVEQPEHAVAVVLVVLGRVDAPLGGDRVGPARAVLVAEALHAVAQLGQRGRGGSPRETRPDDEDRVLPLVGGVDQLHLEAVLVPPSLDRTVGDARPQLHHRVGEIGVVPATLCVAGSFTSPVITAMGNERLPRTTAPATRAAKA